MNISNLYWIDKLYENINFDNLPHGIIINGPDGIGKERLAIKISSKLLVNKNNNNENISISKSNNHPDFFVLDKERILIKHIALREDDWDEEIGKRNVNDFLSVTPSISINKVALILNAQSMNDASQNALLKTLEEPAPHSYIIMTTNRPKSLLDTIYSRCQVITIPPLNENDINEWLLNNGISDISAKDFPSFISPLKIN
jgi:DNA polymerase III, gamma/tau subunits